MLGHKTRKVDAAQSAASTFRVLVCLNTSGDSYTIYKINIILRVLGLDKSPSNRILQLA